MLTEEGGPAAAAVVFVDATTHAESDEQAINLNLDVTHARLWAT